MTPKTLYVVPLFTIFAGLLFAGYGLFAPRGPSVFLAILGFGFLAYGLVILAINRQAFKANGTQA